MVLCIQCFVNSLTMDAPNQNNIRYSLLQVEVVMIIDQPNNPMMYSIDFSYLERFNSGQTNSRTSLVGMLLIFSLLRAGIDSSRTHPRSGSSSLVRTCGVE